MSGEREIPAGYKRTEVGTIPCDWQVARLADHFTIYAGGDVPKGRFSRVRVPGYAIPIYANAVQDGGLYGYTSTPRSKADSVTVTARGYLGHAEYRGEAFLPIVRLLVLEPAGGLDARYTTYVINDRVSFAIESTGVPQLTAPQISKYAIAAPSDVDEQRAIADALGDVDALLDALDRQIAKQRDLKQAAMQQLLTGRTRLPGFTGEWHARRIGDIASIRSGGTPSTSDKRFWNGDVPWCTPTDITALAGRKHLERTERRITPEGLAASSAELIPARSIIMTSRATIGECAINVLPVATNQGFKNLVPATAIDVDFLYYLLGTQKQQFIRLCGGSTFFELSKTQLAAHELNLPPTEAEQTAIAAVLSDMDAAIAALEARRAKTRDLKQAMLQELLTGRTRLV